MSHCMGLYITVDADAAGHYLEGGILVEQLGNLVAVVGQVVVDVPQQVGGGDGLPVQ